MATSPVNPETATPQPEQPVEPQHQSLQEQQRAQVYEQIYGTPQQEPQTTQPTEQTVAPPAEPDYKALFTQLASEVESLKEALTQRTVPAQPVTPVVPEKDWFALLQEGKRTEAEQALKAYVAKGVASQVTHETLQQAQELFRTERTIEDFNTQVRATNPDLLDVEDLVALKAEQYFRANQDKVKSTQTYIDTYKSAVNQAVTDLRNKLQRTRAAAKNEARTTQREVLGASTINPNAIQPSRESSGPQGNEPPDVSPQSYMEMRRAAASQRNLTPDVRRQLNARE